MRKIKELIDKPKIKIKIPKKPKPTRKAFIKGIQDDILKYIPPPEPVDMDMRMFNKGKRNIAITIPSELEKFYKWMVKKEYGKFNDKNPDVFHLYTIKKKIHIEHMLIGFLEEYLHGYNWVGIEALFDTYVKKVIKHKEDL